MRDTSQFRERFQRWKAGELVYDAGKAIPHLAIGNDEEPADATRVFNPRSLIPAIPAFIKNQQALLRQLASLLSYVGPETRERSEVQRVHLQAVLDWSKYLKQKQLEKINEGYEQLATLVDKGVTIASVAVPALKGIGKLASKGISALMKKAAPLRIPKIDMMKSYENDTPARWYLNGGDLNLPEMISVYHGRGTNRGVPEEVIRNYSHKDVGIHVATSREPAEGFAQITQLDHDPAGFLYSGTYVGPRTPDLVVKDFGTWDSGRWAELLNRYNNTKWGEIEQNVREYLMPMLRSSNQTERKTAESLLSAMDRQHSGPQSAKALIDHFKIDPAYILLNKALLDRIKDKYKKKYYEDLTPAEQELEIREYAEANKAYADYLKSKGVAFKYHNDFEGGSYTKPSMFISDPSDVWWDKQILAVPIQVKQPAIGIAYKNPFIPNGKLYPAEQFTTRYKYTYPKQQ